MSTADDVDRAQAREEARGTAQKLSSVKTGTASVVLPKRGEVPPITPVGDAAKEKMTASVTNAIVRAKLKRELEQELDPEGASAGVTQEVHRSVPKMLFMVASKAVKCPRLMLDDDESEILADALSMWLPKLDSKVYAAIVIICMTGAKLLDCQDAISSRLSGVGKRTQSIRFDKKKQATVTR
jgi:hypothetical protein